MRPCPVRSDTVFFSAEGVRHARRQLSRSGPLGDRARAIVQRAEQQLKDLAPAEWIEAARPLGADFFRGRWTLVYFGFTSCPDICPTGLAMLAQVRKLLADLPAAQQPRVLFVSLDPERDSPEHVGNYVRFFDPAFLGATGSPRGVAAAAAAFALPFAKVPLPTGGYTIDHGTAVYLVGPEGSIVAIASGVREPGPLARDYRKTVAYLSQ